MCTRQDYGEEREIHSRRSRGFSCLETEPEIPKFMCGVSLVKGTIEQNIIWTLVPSFPSGGNRAQFQRGLKAILNPSNACWCIRTRDQASHSFSMATSFLFPLPFLYWVTMMVLWRSFRIPVAWEVQSPKAGSQ